MPTFFNKKFIMKIGLIINFFSEISTKKKMEELKGEMRFPVERHFKAQVSNIGIEIDVCD